MKTLTPILCLLLATLAPAAEQWPSFRGQDARGISETAAPTTWDMKSGKNVLWKTPIPGLGLGAAVIWDDRVYLVTAVGKDANPSLKVGLYGNIGAAGETALVDFVAAGGGLVTSEWFMYANGSDTSGPLYDALPADYAGYGYHASSTFSVVGMLAASVTAAVSAPSSFSAATVTWATSSVDASRRRLAVG